MSASGLVNEFGRPFEVYSKQDIENATSKIGPRVTPLVGSILSGPHPFLRSKEDLGFEGTVTSFPGQWHAGGQDWEHASNEAPATGISAQINDRFSKRNPVKDLNVPSDPGGMFTMSMRYAEENYIVFRGIKAKKNFALKDFILRGSVTTREFYKKEFRRLQMRQRMSEIYRYYWSAGRVVAYWGEKRPIERITLLDPRFINVRRYLGKPFVFLRPDGRWRDLLRGDSPEGKALKKTLPTWWIPYIVSDKEIPLKDGTFALIENDLALFSSRGISPLGNIPLQPAFSALQVLNMHLSGDFSTAWMTKNMIALVSIGDPQKEKDYTRADQNELAKLQDAFQRPEYAMWAYVDPTVQIRFVHPDPGLYATDKYNKPTEIIEYVMGLPPVFSPSAGQMDFNAASMSLKPFREEINCGRQDIEDQFLNAIIPVLRDGYTRRVAGTKDPQFDYDQDSLKDDKQILDELTAKYDRGAVSIQSLLNLRAEDIDTEHARKKAEQPDKELWQPLFDMNHGNREGQPGAPQSSTGPQPERTTPSPRPSTS